MLSKYSHLVQFSIATSVHPNAHDLEKINKANMQYNAGVMAGQKASKDINFTSWTCPSSNKDFCDGCKTSTCSSEGCAGDFTCLNPNQPKDAKNCPNDKGYKG
jgi:hypothetical protein